jgi:hypothetical protein
VRRVTDRRSGHHCQQEGSEKKRNHGGCLLIYKFFEGKKGVWEEKKKRERLRVKKRGRESQKIERNFS